MIKPLKMYIFVKSSLPSHKLIAVAHGVLMCHLKYKDDELYCGWLSSSFRKVVCEVTGEEFEYLKQFDRHITVTESGLENMEVALVFCPRIEWPSEFKNYKLSNY